MIPSRIWPFFFGFWFAWIGLQAAHFNKFPSSFWFWGSWVAWAFFMITFWLRKRQ